jgi:hypothetical protein
MNSQALLRTAVASGVLAIAMAAVGTSNAAPIDINGGTSWGGWDSRGNSTDVGIYGQGSTTRTYGLYTSVFTFNNNTFDTSTGGVQVKNALAPAGFAAGAFSTGAFANGHTILGIGLDLNGSDSAVGTTFVTFGLGSDNFKAATTLVSGDGRTSDGSNKWEHAGDLSMWMDGAVNGNGPSNLAAWTSNGTQHGGTGASSNLPGQFGGIGVSYDYAFREFRQGTAAGSIQMFFDLDAMQSLYGVGGTYSAATIGSFGSGFNVSMYNSNANYGNANQVVFGVTLPGATVPEPGVLALVGLGLAGLGLSRRRKA